MKNLIALRKDKNLKQSDVARDIGVSVAAYGFYETDKRQASYETLNLLADYFNTSVDFLLDRTDIQLPVSQWTDEEKAAGVGAHGTKLSAEEWDWLELRSEIIEKRGEAGLHAVQTIIKTYIEK